MAQAPLKLDIGYFPDPSAGKPIALGSVYVGVADTDPVILANRISVTVIQEDGTSVVVPPASQPFTLGSGGTVLYGGDPYGGDPVVILVDGVHSVKVLDALGAQKYYVPFANQSADALDTGVSPVNGSFEFDTLATGQPDNWSVVAGANGTVELSTDSAHGLKSLKFTGTDATGGGVVTSDKFDVLAGRKIDLEFTYKSSAIDTLNKIDVNWYNSADALISTSSVLNEGAANPLTYETSVITATAPATAKRAEIVLTGVDGAGTTVAGSTYFDGLSVRLYTDLTLNEAILISPVFNTGISGTAVLDDDTMATASDTTIATSESIKAYVDTYATKTDTVKTTTSGTTVDWTSIPAGVKRIDIGFSGVRTGTTEELYLTIGDTDGLETTGYVSGCIDIRSAIRTTSTAEFILTEGRQAGDAVNGIVSLILIDPATFTWAITSNLSMADGDSCQAAGTKSLTAVLDRLSLFGELGGTFDAGKAQITYS